MTDVTVEDRRALLPDNDTGYIDYVHYCLLLAERIRRSSNLDNDVS